MLLALPLLLPCFGFQPCHSETAFQNQLIRSSSPAAITQPREDRTPGASLPLRLALQRVSIPPASTRSQARRAQVALRTGVGTKADTVMLVLAGAVVGCYAGTYLGAAIDDSPADMGALVFGMPIGAAVGGLIVWNLVK
jgi:hypothetical protein